MATLKIYHNPRCSKSRETLKLLEEKNAHPEIIDYLQTPPTIAELTELLKKLNLNAEQLVRKNETLYKENRPENLTEATLIKLMVKHPILIQRPIVVKGNKAIIGRPPENVLALL